MPVGSKDNHYSGTGRRRSRSRDNNRDRGGDRGGDQSRSRENRDDNRRRPDRRDEPPKAGGTSAVGGDFIHSSRKTKFDAGFNNGNGAGGGSPKNTGFSQGISLSRQHSGNKPSGFSSMPAGGVGANTPSSSPIIPQQYDLPSRKIYIGGISADHSEAEVAQHLGATLQKSGACLESGNPIIRTQVNREKRYMFVELRSAEEAACLLQLDGIEYKGYPLRVRRCQEYNAAKAPPLKRKTPVVDIFELGIVSTQVQDTPNKVFIGGIPKDWDEEQIKRLLVSNAGKLRSFHLVRDNKDQSSKGYAFCEFATLDGVRMAMQTINQMKVLDQTPGLQGGTKTLNVRRTGKYADQNIDGTINIQGDASGLNPLQRLPSGGILPQTVIEQSSRNPTDVYNRILFEENINLYIKNASSFIENQSGTVLLKLMQNDKRGSSIKSQIDANNLQMKKYLRENYEYEMCSTNLALQITAFDQPMDNNSPEDMVTKNMGSKLFMSNNKQEENNNQKLYVDEKDTPLNEEQKEMFKDMKVELSKFGPIKTIRLAVGGEHRGKIVVGYHNLSSAFICYNLLNNQKYLGQPVQITFIDQID